MYNVLKLAERFKKVFEKIGYGKEGVFESVRQGPR
jgi:hypothetical protein